MADLPKTPEDLIEDWRFLQLPAPGTPRDTFSLLTLLTWHPSLKVLLDRVDFTGVTPLQVYWAVLGRSPDPTELREYLGNYDARSHFHAALQSPEFQRRSPTLFLNAFPEKQRLVFIHLPKCAGTDFEMLISPRFVSIPEALRSSKWFSTTKLLETLSGYADVGRFTETVLYYGHINFEVLRAEIGVRPGDRFFTVLRDPIDQTLSRANYIVHRLATDPERSRPDSRDWLALLDNNLTRSELHNDGGRCLALRVLRDRRIITPDPMCAYLGGGVAERALSNLTIYNFEITDTRRYDRWLSERWSVELSPRYNSSIPVLSRENVAEHLDYIAELTIQDRLLYDRVSKALDRSGASSITGSVLL